MEVSKAFLPVRCVHVAAGKVPSRDAVSRSARQHMATMAMPQNTPGSPVRFRHSQPGASMDGRMLETGEQPLTYGLQSTVMRVPHLKPMLQAGVPILAGCGLLSLLSHSAQLPAAMPPANFRELFSCWTSAAVDLPGTCWQGYCQLLETKPVMTKVLTGLFGCFLGDLLAQTSSHVLAQVKHKQGESKGDAPTFSYNLGHTLRLLMYTGLTTPFLQYWYLMLDTVVMPTEPTSPQAVMLKVACDQGLLTPITTLTFFTFMKVLEDVTGGLPRAEITPAVLFERVRTTVASKYLPTMRACYMVWPLAHVVNFALVPSSQRILYINAVAIMWTAFLSLQTAASGASAHPEGDSAADVLGDAHGDNGTQ